MLRRAKLQMRKTMILPQPYHPFPNRDKDLGWANDCITKVKYEMITEGLNPPGKLICHFNLS